MTARRRARILAMVGVLLGGAVAAPGCAVACPAIAYISTVVIDARAVADVVSMQVCIESECTPEPGEEADPMSLLGVERLDDGTWNAVLDTRTPDRLTVRLYDGSGLLLRDTVEQVEWTFTGGACPGPASASTVVLG